MRRPFLVHFLAVQTEHFLSVRASLATKTNRLISEEKNILLDELPDASFPLQALRLLKAHHFQIRLVMMGQDHQVIFQKQIESDGRGMISLKIPLSEARQNIHAIQVFEQGREVGIEFYLGTFFPLKIKLPKRIVISDFDKTLVDTRYSTTKELYRSLTSPISYFPIVQNSVDLFGGFIKQGFHPFILSASPHFYEDAIRDWLYQNKIYTAGIFLKDYRQIFSLFETDLTPKDLKIQGLYKLNHLLDILMMTGIPDELVLMGDNYESDPIIYLALVMILEGKREPWGIWNALKQQRAFLLNRKQNSLFLSKIFQLSSLTKFREQQNPGAQTKISIYIRRKGDEDKLKLPEEFQRFLAGRHLQMVELYDGHAPKNDSALKGINDLGKES